MIIFTKNSLPEKVQILDYLEKEKNNINLSFNFQHQLKALILQHMQNFANSTDDGTSSCTDIILKYLDNLKNALGLVKENISLIEKELNNIDVIINKITQDTFNLNIDNYSTSDFDIEGTILSNTVQIQDILSAILDYSKLEFTTVQESNTPSIPNINEGENIKKEVEIKTEYEYKENTLIISELKGKVILPYKISELNDILQNHPEKYNTTQDIIEKIYTIPFNMYRNPIIARFREAFKLVHDREHKSIKSAFDLGVELLFNYNLHPAIISACKNIDELDIYLDYLENNETNKFDIFQVVFEIAPVVKM